MFDPTNPTDLEHLALDLIHQAIEKHPQDLDTICQQTGLAHGYVQRLLRAPHFKRWGRRWRFDRDSLEGFDRQPVIFRGQLRPVPAGNGLTKKRGRPKKRVE